MYEKLDKLRDEVKRCEKRVADAQSKLKAAQEKLKEGEASQILSDVGALKMSPEELAKVLELVKSGQLNQGAAANTETKTTHQNKGKSVGQCLKDRTDYAKNGEKTEQGEMISSYACDKETVDEEFMLAKQEYLRITGRKPKGDIIAYQIRQSFKPGEITPEEANEIGYETAMRFTKGNHAFIVATHTDRAHIHNHIIFNSTNLNCDRKFRDSWFIALALQRVSDTVCLEHALSVIKPRKPSERDNRNPYNRASFRNALREKVDLLLQNNPKDFGEFLKQLQEAGYEIKEGKHTAIRGAGQKRFIRFSSLGEGYKEEDIKKRITGEG